MNLSFRSGWKSSWHFESGIQREREREREKRGERERERRAKSLKDVCGRSDAENRNLNLFVNVEWNKNEKQSKWLWYVRDNDTDKLRLAVLKAFESFNLRALNFPRTSFKVYFCVSSLEVDSCSSFKLWLSLLRHFLWAPSAFSSTWAFLVAAFWISSFRLPLLNFQALKRQFSKLFRCKLNWKLIFVQI